MRKNTSGFCGQQPSLIILERNTTPPQLELRTLFPAICRAAQGKKMEVREVRSKSYSSNQSNQLLVNFSVQRLNVSNEHQTSTCGGLIVLCTFPCHISKGKYFPLHCCQLQMHYLRPLRLFFFSR